MSGPVRSHGELAAAYRRLRAPASLAPALRAAAEDRVARRSRRWTWPAVAAAAALVVAVGLNLPTPPEPAARVATGLPSLSQLRNRMPSSSLGEYRVPALGKGVRVPTLPKTPQRGPRADRDKADRSEPEART